MVKRISPDQKCRNCKCSSIHNNTGEPCWIAHPEFNRNCNTIYSNWQPIDSVLVSEIKFTKEKKVKRKVGKTKSEGN